jgi:hypothetical protein
VRPLLIVVAPPSLDLSFSILQAQKPVFIQALLPKTAVIAFAINPFRLEVLKSPLNPPVLKGDFISNSL